MEIRSASKTDGAAVQQNSYSGARNQLYKINLSSGDLYRIQPVHSYKYVDVTNGSMSNGTYIQQKSHVSSCSQRFRFEEVTSGTVTSPATTTTTTTSTTTSTTMAPVTTTTMAPVVTTTTTTLPPATTTTTTTTTTTLPTSLVSKRWFPGHYLYTSDDVNHLGMKDTRRNLVRYNKNWAGYKGQYWWHRLEPQKGVYDFSMIFADLDKAHADGKKMIIMPMERSFHGSSRPFPVPQYIANEMNGVWYDGSSKIFIKIWDPLVAERYFRLIEALAAAVDKHPAFHAIFTEESSFSNIHLQSGYTHAKGAEYFMNLARRGSASVKQGLFIMNMNWGLSSTSTPTRTQVTDDIVYSSKAGVGASDLRIDGGTGTLNTSFGYVYDRYRDVAPLHASVEWNTYQMGWSAAQLIEFGVDRLGLHFIGWQARTDSTLNINMVIAEIDHKQGRINTSRPRNAP